MTDQPVRFQKALGRTGSAEDLAKVKRWPGGAPEGKGGQFAPEGGAAPAGGGLALLASAPVAKPTAKEAKAWRAQVEAAYGSDPQLRAAVDGLTLFTQGGYRDLNQAAAYAVTGRLSDHVEEAGGHYVESAKAALAKPLSAHPLAETKNMVAGQGFAERRPSTATLAEAAAAMRAAIEAAPPRAEPLYRGLAHYAAQQWAAGLKPGDALELPGLVSFTADQAVAEQFARNKGPGTNKRGAEFHAVLEVEPGARAISAAPLSPFNQAEVIVSGRLVVRSVEVTRDDKDEPWTRVLLGYDAFMKGRRAPSEAALALSSYLPLFRAVEAPVDDVEKVKRWPSGAPGSKGGQFAPAGGGSGGGGGKKPIDQGSLWDDIDFGPGGGGKTYGQVKGGGGGPSMGGLGSWKDGGSSGKSWATGPKGPIAPPAPPPGARPHPRMNDKGEPVTVNHPTKPSAPDTWANPRATATFVPDGDVPAELNGVPFAPWTGAPTDLDGWARVEGQDPSIDRDFPFVPTDGKSVGAGVIVQEPDGRIWLTRPTNGFGGYNNSFPKGTEEPGLSLQASAIKEAFEETGLQVRITGVVGDFERTTSRARFFTAERVGGTPRDMGWESQAVRLAPPAELAKLLNMPVDRGIVKVWQDQFDLKKARAVAIAKRARITAPLYVTRTVMNAPSVLEHFARQGVPGLVAAEDLHVTVVYSKTPVPWSAVPEDFDLAWAAPGMRAVERFGEVLVLELLEAPELQERHAAWRAAGASADFDPYRPHVTISTDPTFDPSGIEPFWGPIILGPERFEPIVDDTGALKAPWPVRVAKAAPTKPGGFNANQARWPSGSPLGGQWKAVGADGLTMPPKIATASNPAYQKQADGLHKQAQAGGVASITHAVVGLQAKVKANAEKGAKSSHVKWTAQVAQYGTALLEELLAKPKAEAAAAKITGPMKLAGMKKVGEKPGGSNPGAIYADASGKAWLVKGNNAKGKYSAEVSDDRARNEVLAAKLMEAAGAGVTEYRLMDLGDKFGGGLGVATAIVEGFASADHPSLYGAIQADFAVHAWLGNYDVLGASMDNTVMLDGKAVCIDPGGALLFRAQGVLKPEFKGDAPEFETMRDPAWNKHGAKVYGKMTASQLKESAQALAAVSDETIKQLVAAHGPKMAPQLADVLIARRDAILAKVGLKGTVSAGPPVTAPKDVPPVAKPILTAESLAAGGLSKSDWQDLQDQHPGTNSYEDLMLGQAAAMGSAADASKVKATTKAGKALKAALVAQLGGVEPKAPKAKAPPAVTVASGVKTMGLKGGAFVNLDGTPVKSKMLTAEEVIAARKAAGLPNTTHVSLLAMDGGVSLTKAMGQMAMNGQWGALMAAGPAKGDALTFKNHLLAAGGLPIPTMGLPAGEQTKDAVKAILTGEPAGAHKFFAEQLAIGMEAGDAAFILAQKSESGIQDSAKTVAAMGVAGPFLELPKDAFAEKPLQAEDPAAMYAALAAQAPDDGLVDNPWAEEAMYDAMEAAGIDPEGEDQEVAGVLWGMGSDWTGFEDAPTAQDVYTYATDNPTQGAFKVAVLRQMANDPTATAEMKAKAAEYYGKAKAALEGVPYPAPGVIDDDPFGPGPTLDPIGVNDAVVAAKDLLDSKAHWNVASAMGKAALAGDIGQLEDLGDDGAPALKDLKASLLGMMGVVPDAPAKPKGVNPSVAQALVNQAAEAGGWGAKGVHATASKMMYDAAVAGDAMGVEAAPAPGPNLKALKANLLTAMGAGSEANVAAATAAAAFSPPTPGATAGAPNFAALMLPASNSNATTVNPKVAIVQALYEKGDAAGILALGFGSNNYNVKLVAAANDALAALGSPHQVVKSQKAGTHPALSGGVAAAPIPAPLAATAKATAPSPAGKPKASKKPTIDQIQPKDLPPVPDVFNLKGPGSPYSSKPWKNQANQDALKAIQQAGLKGKDAIDALMVPELHPETGVPTGKQIPIADHPSKSLIGSYINDVKLAIETFLNPPEPFKPFTGAKAASLAALSAKFAAAPVLTKTSVLPANQKVGFWLALGQVKNPEILAPKVKRTFTPAEHAAGWKAYQAYSAMTKTYVRFVQGSGAANDAFREGKSTYKGKSTVAMAKAAYKDATPLPAGSTIYRWQSMDADMIKQLKTAEPGLIMDALGSMCASYHPTCNQHFGSKNRIVIRAGDHGQSRALMSYGTGGYSSEREITTLPGQRYMLLGVKANPGGWTDYEVVMLPSDPPKFSADTTSASAQQPLSPGEFSPGSQTPLYWSMSKE